MRIVYLHPHFTAEGGAGRMVLETGRRLAGLGHEVHCICIRADGAIVGQSRDAITFHEIDGPLSSRIGFWLGFRRSCRGVCDRIRSILGDDASQNTVLFPQVFPANWWGVAVMRAFPDLPCVWFCQEPSAFIHSNAWMDALPFPKNWIAWGLNPVFKAIDLRRCREFSRVLVNSEFSRGYTRRVYDYSEQGCRTIYLGVDHDRFMPTSGNRRQPTVVVICKLTRFKNVDRVIAAVALLRDEGIEVRCDIVGTGDAYDELRDLATRLRVDSQVTFHGRVDDAAAVTLLQQASVFCLASDEEPFGLVLIEAMACGTPVVAMNSGGPREIVSGHNCGVLVDEPSAAALASALRRVLEDDAAYQRMSLAAITRASQFNWDRTVADLEEHFHAALANAP